ncbi:hypothetical protein GCM10007385_19030 [Tateyamaria omphalii]|uniref:hypothetical protein n=1 Tax=Tateyamaria omphalii TaxID=299262 RepID=UPI001671B1C5|nr:hypothetical protein [Tateyamaria omphalii]GGX50726.1 hypothetical protein GCM10007385_19030 [Tateyamaria omphalii]
MVMRDPVSGALVGRAWEVALADQSNVPPPIGMWFTAKLNKSYIYDATREATE